MNNEEMILALLENMDRRMTTLEGGQANLIAGQANLIAGQAKMQEDINEIKSDIKYLWEDVGRIGDRLNVQEKIIEKKIM